nr:hypothetical protein [Sphingomicrobium lutaoense]
MIAALSLSLAKVALPPEPPAIVVDFVDEVGLTAAAPVQESAPAAQAVSPEPELAPAPEVEELPPPPPRVEPTPAPRPRAAEPPPRPSPPRARSETPRQERPRPRQSRLGDDFLEGVAEGNSRTGSAETGQAAAPVIDAAAMASIQQAIRRQVQPCADRQIDPGPGANQIRVTLNLRLAPDGRLSRPPRVVRTQGVNADNERYEERVKDLAINTYVDCSPLRGLPPELYSTAQGGWSNINMTYRLP